MRQRLIVFIGFCLLAIAAAPAAFAQQTAGVALVIGNAAYPDADAPLPEPVGDARALGDELRRRGFDVTVGENLKKQAMQRALDQFYGKINSSTTAVIFFSGFGIQSDRQSYMIPVDAQIWNEADVRRDGFSLDKVLADLTGKGAQVKVAIIDASRRNPFERRFRNVSAGLAAVAVPRATVVMTSAASDTVVGDGTTPVFVSQLVKELKTPDATVEQIFNRTRTDVSRETKGQQVPWFSSSLDGDVTLGSLPQPAVATVAPKPSSNAPPAAPAAKPAAPAAPVAAPIAAPAPSVTGSRVALVVGNSIYQHAPALPNPAKDAQAMAATFQKAGFDVVNASYNVSNLEFKRAIRQFEHAASEADIAVVYYAGHGIELNGTNYLVPVDASLATDDDAEDEAISLDRLIQSVDGAKRLRVVILDACRDNPFRPTTKPRIADPAKQNPAGSAGQHPGSSATGLTRGIGPTRGLTAVQPTDINTLIAYAAKAGQSAEDGNTEHSPFATALLDNLFVAGLDVRLAFGRVRDEVLKTTSNRQEPFVYGSLGGGNISLVPAPGQPAAAAEDPDKVKADYGLVEKIGTKGAWGVFLTQHPTGFYSDLARQQIAALELPKSTPAPPAEDQQAWDKIKDSGNASDFRDFIKNYPSSAMGAVAEVRADALEQAAKQREREEAMQREEQALRAQLAEAKRQADEAARQRAAQDAALAKAQHDAQVADQARQQAERQAQLKADEAARQKQLADAALAQQQAAVAAAKQAAAATAKQTADQDAAAAQKKAEQDAAVAKAQQEAQAAEQARQQAVREAALKAQEAAKQEALSDAARKQEAACSDEQSRLNTLQAAGSKAKDDLKQLAQGLTCERLRPLVTAALEKASAADVNTPDQVRAAQQQLTRLGCYSDAVDGSLSDSTKAAITHYQGAQGEPTNSDVKITDAFVSELKKQSARVCPLVCPSGKAAQGDQCVVVEQPKPAPAVAHHGEDDKAQSSKKTKAEDDKPEPKRAKQEPASRPQQPRTSQEASSAGHAGAAIGVGF
jgi:uncharacterized caspase-like protein